MKISSFLYLVLLAVLLIRLPFAAEDHLSAPLVEPPRAELSVSFPVPHGMSKIEGIPLDMRYATDNNFLGKRVYDDPSCYLKEEAKVALAKAQSILLEKGYSLSIWDCYRSREVQKKMWSIMPDSRYVANPATGSRHNTGEAVDLTLMKDEKEIPMPTAFDEFSESAHWSSANGSKEWGDALMLKAAMESVGFSSIATEWWHYQL